MPEEPQNDADGVREKGRGQEGEAAYPAPGRDAHPLDVVVRIVGVASHEGTEMARKRPLLVLELLLEPTRVRPYVQVGVVLLIENEWVATKYERLYRMRCGRGGLIVHELLLKFERFLAWLMHAVNQAFGFVDRIVGSATAKERRLTNPPSKEVTGNY